MASKGAQRTYVIRQIAEIADSGERSHPFRVGIDGLSGSGKTSLSDELANELQARGRNVTQIHQDDFHNLRALRHRQGRNSARGYYEDAFNWQALIDFVLVPLGPGGDRRYRRRIMDLDTDIALDEDRIAASADDIVIVEGTFLQRPELVNHWDLRVFVEVGLHIARSHGVARDSLKSDPALIAQLWDERYQPSELEYLSSDRPLDHADVRFVNEEIDRPRLIDQRERS